jgi:class 3 adenylate cyclase/DNA-binding NarL/FixJ family response regulator
MRRANVPLAGTGRLLAQRADGGYSLSQVRIAYVGGTEEEHQAFESIVKDDGTIVVRFLLPAEAIATLIARTTDLLMIDVMQPSHDVLALLKTAKTEHGPTGRIPVIVVAGTDATSRVQACLHRGADDYVLLPHDQSNPLLVHKRISAALRVYAANHSLVKPPPADTAVMPIRAPGKSPMIIDAAWENVQTVHRFIPREFLDMLERKSLADVKLGDHMQREMTVFFSDIRDFTQLSERLTPQENFSFLTSYLRNVTPIIRARGGFVDKYLGDGVMALFPGAAIDAVQAAVDLGQQIGRYNHGRRLAGYAPIKIGTGLHRGSLMLGTIGAEDQMQTTVIADAVNLASRIEGMTKTFGVNLLLSGSVIENLPKDHKFRLRALGAVRAKGKSEAVEIYECYDNDAHELGEHKDKTQKQFAAGMVEYRKGMLLTAGRIFSRIAEICPEDTVAAYFRDRCTLSVVRERAGPWDGAEHLEVK